MAHVSDSQDAPGTLGDSRGRSGGIGLDMKLHIGISRSAPRQEQRVPKHPARHDAPTDHRGERAFLQLARPARRSRRCRPSSRRRASRTRPNFRVSSRRATSPLRRLADGDWAVINPRAGTPLGYRKVFECRPPRVYSCLHCEGIAPYRDSISEVTVPPASGLDAARAKARLIRSSIGHGQRGVLVNVPS
jgi:hypothetical protein